MSKRESGETHLVRTIARSAPRRGQAFQPQQSLRGLPRDPTQHNLQPNGPTFTEISEIHTHTGNEHSPCPHSAPICRFQFAPFESQIRPNWLRTSCESRIPLSPEFSLLAEIRPQRTRTQDAERWAMSKVYIKMQLIRLHPPIHADSHYPIPLSTNTPLVIFLGKFAIIRILINILLLLHFHPILSFRQRFLRCG